MYYLNLFIKIKGHTFNIGKLHKCFKEIIFNLNAFEQTN